jgi:hypothetical protein
MPSSDELGHCARHGWVISLNVTFAAAIGQLSSANRTHKTKGKLREFRISGLLSVPESLGYL